MRSPAWRAAHACGPEAGSDAATPRFIWGFAYPFADRLVLPMKVGRGMDNRIYRLTRLQLESTATSRAGDEATRSLSILGGTTRAGERERGMVRRTRRPRPSRIRLLLVGTSLGHWRFA